MYNTHIMNAAGELGNLNNEERKHNSTKILVFFYFEAYTYIPIDLYLFYNSQIIIYVPLQPVFFT